MRILRSSKEIEMSSEEFLNRIEGYDDILIDLGTGQGAFVYFNACENRNVFYIGLDSCRDSMKKYAIKQYKNKIENLIYVVMNAQKVDDIFKNKISKVYINLPWGSLLQGIFKEELNIINSISFLLKSYGELNMCFSYDEKFEKYEIEKRGLPKLNEEYFNQVFIPMYLRYGIKINSINYISKSDINFRSKWMHVLSESKERMFYLISGEKK